MPIQMDYHSRASWINNGCVFVFSYIVVSENCDGMKYNFGAFLDVCMCMENVERSKRNLINFGMNKV